MHRVPASYRRGLGDAFTFGGHVEGGGRRAQRGRRRGAQHAGGRIRARLGAKRHRLPRPRLRACGELQPRHALVVVRLGMRRADAGYRNLNDPAATLFGTLRGIHVGVAVARGRVLAAGQRRPPTARWLPERACGAAGSLQAGRCASCPWARSASIAAVPQYDDAAEPQHRAPTGTAPPSVRTATTPTARPRPGTASTHGARVPRARAGAIRQPAARRRLEPRARPGRIPGRARSRASRCRLAE